MGWEKNWAQFAKYLMELFKLIFSSLFKSKKQSPQKPQAPKLATKKPKSDAFPLSISLNGAKDEKALLLNSKKELSCYIDGNEYILIHDSTKYVLYNQETGSMLNIHSPRFQGKSIDFGTLGTIISDYIKSGRGYPLVRTLSRLPEPTIDLLSEPDESKAAKKRNGLR